MYLVNICDCYWRRQCNKGSWTSIFHQCAIIMVIRECRKVVINVIDSYGHLSPRDCRTVPWVNCKWWNYLASLVNINVSIVIASVDKSTLFPYNYKLFSGTIVFDIVKALSMLTVIIDLRHISQPSNWFN